MQLALLASLFWSEWHVGRTCLLAGQPGVGKTTLLRKLVETLPGRCGGFFTNEVRRGGARVGFDIHTLDGQCAALARVNSPHLPQVGRYGVHVGNVDAVAVPAVERAVAAADYVVIDEIGKMELVSESFRAAVLRAVRCPRPVLGTVMSRPHPWADALKRLPQVLVVTVTLTNRDVLLDELRAQLAAWPV